MAKSPPPKGTTVYYLSGNNRIAKATYVGGGQNGGKYWNISDDGPFRWPSELIFFTREEAVEYARQSRINERISKMKVLTTQVDFPKRLPKDHYLWSVPGALNRTGTKLARNVYLLLDRPLRKQHTPFHGPNLAGEVTTKLKATIDGKPVWDYPVEYQRDLLENYSHYEAVYLKWAGGSGKTVASILWSICNSTLDTATVVVTTAGAKPQWSIAYQKLSTIVPKVCYGRDLDSIDKSDSVIILNWEIIAANKDAIIAWLNKFKYRILILDEIHKGKSWRRVTRKINEITGELDFEALGTAACAMASIARQCQRRIGLSATPYSIGVIDLWSQLDALEPNCWGKSSEFAFRYCDARPGEHGGLDTSGSSNLDELKPRLKTLIHTVSRQQMEAALPGKSRQIVRLRKDDLNSPFRGSKSFLKEAAANGEKSLWEAQISLAASMKRDWTASIASEALTSGQRVVILTSRRAEVERIAKAIYAKLPKKMHNNVMWSHGDSGLTVREEQRLRYANNPDEALCLIGTHDAWGVAIDGLQSTDVAIMNAIPWTPRILNQSETRFTRQGQTRKTIIYYPLAEGTVDENVIQNLINRLETLSETLAGEEESQAASQALAGIDDADGLLQDLLSSMGG